MLDITWEAVCAHAEYLTASMRTIRTPEALYDLLDDVYARRVSDEAEIMRLLDRIAALEWWPYAPTNL